MALRMPYVVTEAASPLQTGRMRMLTMTPAPERAAIRGRRRWFLIAAAAIALLGIVPQPAEAQRRAKLSRDLEARLAGAGAGRAEVILDRLPADEIERLAAKHGATIKRHFSRGAVLDVDAEALRALAADPIRRAELGANGRRYAEAELSRDAVLHRFEAQLLALAQARSMNAGFDPSTGQKGEAS